MKPLWKMLVPALCTLASACGGGGTADSNDNRDASSIPPAPHNLAAVAGISEVVLSWDEVREAASYNVYLATEAGVTPTNYLTLAGGAKLTHVPNPAIVNNLIDATLYYFVVTAVNPAGESEVSNQARAAPLERLSSNASLLALSLSTGTLTPSFDPAVSAYFADVAFATANITVTPTSADPAAALMVNGATVTSSLPSSPLPLGGGANVIDIVVTAEDGITTRAYSITVKRQAVGSFAQEAFIKASNTGAADEFGYALALQSDTLVVGAPFEAGDGSAERDDSTTDAGAVYVFVRDSGNWSQQAYIKASNAGAGDEFGHSVALAGDTLAVGARNEASAVTGIDGNPFNNSASGAGAVYVFVRHNGVWSQQAYIKASNTGAADQFGTSVMLAGDTLAVGAPLEDSAADTVNGEQLDETATNSGAVYVFIRDALNNWLQQAYIKASNTGADDRFGHQVALSDDTLAVSAHNEDSASVGVDGEQSDETARNAGAVYVFVRDGTGGWSQQAYVKASNTGDDDHFGSSLAVHGDTLAVGARYEDSAANAINGEQQNEAAFNAGAAYVFVRDGPGGWSQQAYLKSANSGARDRFGWSIGLDADTLIVGAPLEASAATGVDGDANDNSAPAAGAAYVFTRGAGAWSQTAYLKPSNTGEADEFGHAVAISGSTIAVGARAEDSAGTGVDSIANGNAPDAGATYVDVRN